MALFLSPVANFQQFFDNDGNPLSGGKLFTYVAGSFSSMLTTYSDNDWTENENPIVLDSSGRAGPIWLDDTSLYNFVLMDEDESEILMSLDNVGTIGEE